MNGMDANVCYYVVVVVAIIIIIIMANRNFFHFASFFIEFAFRNKISILDKVIECQKYQKIPWKNLLNFYGKIKFFSKINQSVSIRTRLRKYKICQSYFLPLSLSLKSIIIFFLVESLINWEKSSSLLPLVVVCK